MNSKLLETFPDNRIVNPLEFENVLNVFSWEDRLIEYSNTDMIENGFDVLLDNRIPIAISSRDIQGKPRNWAIENWKTLYQLINDSDKYIAIIVGCRISRERGDLVICSCLLAYAVCPTSVHNINIKTFDVSHLLSGKR